MSEPTLFSSTSRKKSALIGDDDMKKSKVRRQCTEILQVIIATGCTRQFDQRTLETAITMTRGGDPRTIHNWTRNLIRLGFIQRFKRRVAVIYELNLMRCPELLNEYVKPGQRKLM